MAAPALRSWKSITFRKGVSLPEELWGEDGSILRRHDLRGIAPIATSAILRWIASRDPNPLCWEKEGRRLIVTLRDRSVKDARCYLVREAGPELSSFTSREISILYWLVMGKTNVEIGIILRLATNTIKKHLTIIFGKQGVEHRTAAALYAREFFPEGDMAAGEPQ